jgi:TRAP-type C4-dicarboxylate transport system permease large subunit
MFTILTLTLGLITPPVGVCLYVACRIGDIKVGTLVRAVVPFLLAEIAVVLLIILVPGLSTFLPGLFH